MESNYIALSQWAEQGNISDANPNTALSGKNATQAARTLLSGKPSLGHTNAQGQGRSPRRQVRLPQELNTKLDAYAHQYNMTVSQTIRNALEYFFNRDNFAA